VAERASAVLLVPAVVAVVAVLAIGLARLGAAAHERGRAQSVADVAALAAAAHGPAAGQRVARANGAGSIRIAAGDGATAHVTLQVGRAGATAVATTRPRQHGAADG
jgi:hypothetical protein